MSGRGRYLLCTNVVSYRDAEGRRYLDPLWRKDLLAHLLLAECERMGLNALDFARGITHTRMHRERRELLSALWGARPGREAAER